VGVDVLLEALPSTAIQLAHACMAAGYQTVIPATWGDELIAAAYLDELGRRDGRPAVCCSCPLVAARLTESGGELAHALIPLVPPPVAAARYLRRIMEDTKLHITYAGSCSLEGEGYDTSIDSYLTPTELLDRLATRGISIARQPAAFDAVLPPDRRRHLSLPGGVPSPEALAARALPYRVLEITGDDYATELAEQLIAGDSLLLDVAPWLGCSCSGAIPGVEPAAARGLAAALEPPRSLLPVVDLTLPLELRLEPPAPPPATETGERDRATDAPRHDRPSTGPRSRPCSRLATPPSVRATTLTPRRTPVIVPRDWVGAFPRARSAEGGRRLPRAYMATRRSHPWLAPVAADPSARVPNESRPAGVVADGEEFDSFVSGLAAAVTADLSPISEWRSRLDAEIERWETRGYVTTVLQRARALATPPDVDGLLITFAAAASYLRRLESLAVTVRPSLRGAPVFRDPMTVRAAEELVDGILRS